MSPVNRIPNWCYPENIKDVESIKEYLRRHYCEHAEESTMRLMDFPILLDEDDMASDSDTQAATQQSVKAYVDAGGGGVPEGTIIAWIGGYFTDSSNGGYTRVLGTDNTVAAVNALLNGDGWYVCDGAALNNANSTIFNGANRYLPNLTDDRFIMGDTLAGGTGGSSTMAHTHSVTSNVAVATHGITQPTFTGASHRHTVNPPSTVSSTPSQSWLICSDYEDTYMAGEHHTHTVDIAEFNSGYAGTGACSRTTDVALSNNHSVTNNAVTSGAASDTENRPKFLGCFYIMQVL